MKFMANYSKTNGYPDTMFNKTLGSFLNNEINQLTKVPPVLKEIKHIKLPHLGDLIIFRP